MKYMKRAKIYQCSNYKCMFNPKTIEAHSYKWWRFVAVIDGLVIFNDYRYSVTTAKHQSKVRSLMQELGIKIDITLALPRGIRQDQTLEELIVEAEEELCHRFLEEEVKKQERYARAKYRRKVKKLENYLENQVHFRDFDIEPASRFGSINKIAVHQIVDMPDMEHDVQNALYNFQRDGFGSIVFYIEQGA